MAANSTIRFSLIAPLLVTGCAGIVAPIPDPVPGFTAARSSVAAAADAASAAAGRRCGSPGASGCFYGGMGETLDLIAARRLEYARRVQTSINDTALYNALLYPAGATVLYRRLRGSPHSGLVFPASVAAAAYGFMNSGVPEVHKHYVRAARELLCLEVRHAEWVYRIGEIDGRPDVTPAYSTADDSLIHLIGELEKATTAYAAKRTSVLGALQPPRKPAGPADAFERARGVSGGSAKKDQRAEIERYTAEQLAIAWGTLDRLRALKRKIGQAAGRLQLEFEDVEREVQAGIADRAPPPRDPEVVASELKKRIANAQAGLLSASRMDPLLPLELREGVRSPETSLLDLVEPAAAMQVAWMAARRFEAEHLQRAAQVAADVETLRCKERAEPIAPAPQPGASAPGSPLVAPLPKS